MRTLSPRNNAACGFAALIAAAALFAAPAAAQYPEWADTETERKGYDIAKASDDSDNGFGDTSVDLSMVLTNAAGQETTRAMSFLTLERASAEVGDKSLVVFESPRDVEGTALLSHAQIIEPDNQWLYLPALKRVKRISSANKSGPFVGSEFAFEDFTSLELNKYTYDFVEQTEITQGDATYTVDVVVRFPAYANSGYARQVSYIDAENQQVRRIEFFDRSDSPLKTLELTDFREYPGGFWRAHTLTMENQKTGKSTILQYSDYTFGVGLSDSDFVKGVLERAR